MDRRTDGWVMNSLTGLRDSDGQDFDLAKASLQVLTKKRPCSCADPNLERVSLTLEEAEELPCSLVEACGYEKLGKEELWPWTELPDVSPFGGTVGKRQLRPGLMAEASPAQGHTLLPSWSQSRARAVSRLWPGCLGDRCRVDVCVGMRAHKPVGFGRADSRTERFQTYKIQINLI